MLAQEDIESFRGLPLTDNISKEMMILFCPLFLLLIVIFRKKIKIYHFTVLVFIFIFMIYRFYLRIYFE